VMGSVMRRMTDTRTWIETCSRTVQAAGSLFGLQA